MRTIILGDALKILPTLGRFDLVLTDPPYSSGARKREWRSGGSVEAALYEAAKHAPRMIVFSASSGRSVERICSAVAAVLPLARVLPWCKPHTRCRACGPFGWQSVLVLMFGKNGGPSRAEDNCHAEAMQYRKQGTTGHPAEIPSTVSEWLFKGLGDARSVLDPFCGTGELLRPFAEAGRDVTGIDIDERWVTEAKRRINGREAGKE